MLVLDAGGQAVPRLQQPVDVREHRSRRRARRARDSASGGNARYANPFMATEVARPARSRSWPRSRPATSTCSSSRNGGAEANENAIKIARQYTGRHKILARYRSYHGATAGSMMLTGDPRRWAAEPGMAGVVHVLEPVSRDSTRMGQPGAGARDARGDDPARRRRRRSPRSSSSRSPAPTASSFRPTGICRASASCARSTAS